MMTTDADLLPQEETKPAFEVYLLPAAASTGRTALLRAVAQTKNECNSVNPRTPYKSE